METLQTAPPIGVSRSSEPPVEAIPTVAETFREMFVELVQHWELLWQMTVRDLKLRYKQSLMGFGWALLMPVMIVFAGCMIRAAMAHMAGEGLALRDVTAMVIKAIPWAFFVGSVSFAVNSLTSNLNLVTKIYFPREVFPLSAMLTQAVDSSIGVVALAVLMAISGTAIGLTALWAVPLVAMLFALTGGACLLLACGNLFYRDVKYIVQLLLNFGIFFTPVLFEPLNLGASFGSLMMLNPLSPILEGLRLAVVEGHNLLTPLVQMTKDNAELVVWTPWHLVYGAVWSVGGFLGSWYLFHKLEFVYAEYI
jgi:ABC-type polysaccharide/polyol phosphate export permease